MQLIRKRKQKNELTGRNANYTVPYLAYLDFSFCFLTPNPRYERIITKRNELGRIIHSKVPATYFLVNHYGVRKILCFFLASWSRKQAKEQLIPFDETPENVKLPANIPQKIFDTPGV